MRSSKLLWVAVFSLALPAISFGAGFGIFEAGAKAVGMSGAFTATADDPSTMFYNPAGLAFQKGSKMMMGATLIMPFNSFEGGNPYPGEGVTEDGKKNLFYPPGIYYARQFGEKLTFGIGAFTAFGLGTEWENPDQYTGRFISTKADIQSLSIQPTVAYRLSDKLGVGVGLEVRNSKVALHKHQPFLNPYTLKVLDVAKVDLESDMAISLGFALGVLAKPFENWSVGFSYRHSMKADYEGTAKFTFIPTGNAALDALLKTKLPLGDHAVKTSINFPKEASFGIATTAIEKWTVEVDVNWTSWSEFDTLVIEFTDLNSKQTIPQDYKDAVNCRLGLQRQMSEKLALRGGYIYDQTPQPRNGAGPLLPDSDRHGFNVGFGYTLGKWTLDVANLFLFFEDRSTYDVDGKHINKDGYDGTYKTFANLLAFSLSYQF
ncbi:MAG: outer membrane protein transport protein [Acidobacteriota bacterium]